MSFWRMPFWRMSKDTLTTCLSDDMWICRTLNGECVFVQIFFAECKNVAIYFWRYVKKSKCDFDDMWKSRDVFLPKCDFDDMWKSRNVVLTNVILPTCEKIEMSFCRNIILSTCDDVEKSKCIFSEMYFYRKRRNLIMPNVTLSTCIKIVMLFCRKTILLTSEKPWWRMLFFVDDLNIRFLFLPNHEYIWCTPQQLSCVNGWLLSQSDY